MWRRRKQPDHVAPTFEQIEEALAGSDVHEARALRGEATRELAYLRMQSGTVARLASKLIARRDENHFGEEVQITFTPRRSHG